MCGGSFGSGGSGSSSFGGGASLFVVSAEQEALNAILVTFSVAPDARDPATSWDALNPSNWTIVAIDPVDAPPRLVQYVERGPTSEQVRVFADGPLGAPATYRIIASAAVQAAGGGVIDPSLSCRSATFATHPPTRVLPAVALTDPETDLANPQTAAEGSSALLGTYQITDQGDLANETGRPYLRKRILRRASTGISEFFHLPGYGFAESIKGTIRPSMLARMQSRAQAQIMREPDVAACVVRAFQLPARPGFVVLDIRVRDTNGEDHQLTVPVPITRSAG